MSMNLWGWILAAIFGLSLLFSNHACAFEFPRFMQASAGRGQAADIRVCQSTYGMRTERTQACLHEVERQKLAVFHLHNSLYWYAQAKQDHRILSALRKCFHHNYARYGISAMQDCLNRVKMTVQVKGVL